MTLTTDKLEKLLNIGESDIVDFKQEHYFFSTSISDKDKTADLVKDILCMTNTVRSDSAYILIGIKEDSNGKGIAVGISEDSIIDDATLQQKVKNKIYPMPKFVSYVLEYKDVAVAVIEIPVSWYQSMPIPTASIKGLEANRVYLRRNTSNDIANPNEIVLLDKWLQSLSMLPEAGEYVSIEDYRKKTDRNLQNKTKPTKVSFDEATIQVLFGNEAAEDEDSGRLREYYFKNETFDSVVVDLPIRILVGHKGIGKSALFTVAIAEDLERQHIPVVIRPDDVAELAQEEDEFLKVIRNWKIGIVDIIKQKLHQFFKIPKNTSIYSTEKTNYDVRTSLNEYLEEAIDEGILGADLIPFATNLINGLPINIYIDDLDRGWKGSQKDIKRLSALLNAIRDLVKTGSGLQFKISLRSDVYFLVRTSDESTDKIGSSVIWYGWTNHEILIMLIKRVETFFGRDINESSLLKSQQKHIAYYLDNLIEKRFRGSGKWDDVPMYRVLMSLIRKRPRDLVKLLTLAARVARKKGNSLIMTDNLKEIFDEYSQDRLQDTVNEYRSELPDIERLLLAMKPTRKAQQTINNYAFTTPELVQKLSNIMEQGKFRFATGKEADAKDLIQFLYKINFLTARKELPTGEIDRKYFEESRYMTSKFVDFGYDWEIHMAYRWALQPQTIDSIFDSLSND